MNSQSLDLDGHAGARASARTSAASAGTGVDATTLPARRVTLGDFMDDLPVGALHRFVVWVIGIGLFFDMYEIFLVSTIGSALQHEYGLSRQSADFKLLLASAFIGMFVGAMCLGSLADRIGRRKAFLLTLGWYSAFSLVGAFSVSADMLVACRFLTGIGVGAIYPVADSFLSEILPKDKRGRLAAWAYTTSYVAVPLVGFLALWLNPLHVAGVAGWRIILAVGSLGAVYVLLVQHRLPESPRWLLAQGRTADAHAALRRFAQSAGVPVPEHFAEPVQPQRPLGLGERIALLRRRPYGARYVMLAIFHLFQGFGYYGFGTLAGTVVKSRGFDVTDSTLFIALSFIGYPIGSLLSIPLLNWIERRTLVIVSILSIAVFGLCFAYSGNTVLIVGFGFLTTCASNVFSNAYHVYQAEIFPAGVRSTAIGSTYALSRIVSGALPFVLLPVLVDYGAGAMFGVISVALGIVAVTLRVLGPLTTRRSQDEINPV
ncbi:MFS transporter [Burkholderia sp. BCCIQ04A]|uniref:MFS transporter n=1 Tax=Burkholderia anthinoferrum TaxID=3090833 RepID=A0ABU5WGD5_9BURK|nr:MULTISPECIES: MFS transporter [Burkholderia]MEB2501916.1 MFS transporter [Burkholderia anthinoferrum]MEB2532449.1 MFS transporter [Burkholderia anthinoferrum]MEB2564089.1 MFS transporter [Burkholderia anthinoferrum]MEB2577785.1 MFS transporter [Burkholderia anthinoferrum]KVH02884.1 MFS transporter [Burkholderia anthina]